ncbi:hypothetical protein [Oceanicola sp. 502str15]|uniref:hypothetical protein n=1 Tax=Oceanicola sp. 502str15 TaxID=2696061 RepID=UPI0020953D40|nr:hypothetical protein [Oceanicola sp. 502str15]MCO6383626.1 hypothetical protein [Oceanicola sp. 502str15]
MRRHKINYDLDRLREIGWSKWDPIGLLEAGVPWRGQTYEDEYDTYLLRAWGMLRNGAEKSEVVGYLYGIEARDMGLGPSKDVAKRHNDLLLLVEMIDEHGSNSSDGY